MLSESEINTKFDVIVSNLTIHFSNLRRDLTQLSTQYAVQFTENQNPVDREKYHTYRGRCQIIDQTVAAISRDPGLSMSTLTEIHKRFPQLAPATRAEEPVVPPATGVNQEVSVGGETPPSE